MLAGSDSDGDGTRTTTRNRKKTTSSSRTSQRGDDILQSPERQHAMAALIDLSGISSENLPRMETNTYNGDQQGDSGRIKFSPVDDRRGGIEDKVDGQEQFMDEAGNLDDFDMTPVPIAAEETGRGQRAQHHLAWKHRANCARTQYSTAIPDNTNGPSAEAVDMVPTSTDDPRTDHKAPTTRSPGDHGAWTKRVDPRSPDRRYECDACRADRVVE